MAMPCNKSTMFSALFVSLEQETALRSRNLKMCFSHFCQITAELRGATARHEFIPDGGKYQLRVAIALCNCRATFFPDELLIRSDYLLSMMSWCTLLTENPFQTAIAGCNCGGAIAALLHLPNAPRKTPQDQNVL